MDYRSAQDCQGLVRRTSLRLYRQFASLRASHEFEDFEQEMWLEWVTAKEAFKPEMGYAFTTFYGTCCRNRTIKLVSRKRLIKHDKSEEKIMDLFDGAEEIEDQVSRDQIMAKVTETMDERLRRMVEFLIEEPELLQKEAEAFACKYARGTGQGRSEEPVEITLPMLFTLMGLSRSQGYRLIAQLKENIDGYHQ